MRLSLVFTSDISISKITKDKFSSEVYEDKAERIFFLICFCPAIAYPRSLMLVLMLMLMLMSHASVDLFVLSFVLPCAYAYVASENQALLVNHMQGKIYLNIIR